MKKMILKLMLTLALTTQFALANQNHSNIQFEIEDLKVSLTTEWDGKDQKILQDKMREFAQKLKDLGVTQEDLITVLQNEAQDSGFKLELNKALEVLKTEKMQTSEIQDLLMKDARKISKSGASWKGEDPGKVAIVILLSSIALGAFSYSMYNIVQD